MYISKELQDRVEENSLIIEEMVNTIVEKYTDELDKYVKKIEKVLESSDDVTDEDMNRIMIRLSTFAYFVGSKSELAAIRKDISEITKTQKYNENFMNLTGTIAKKNAEAESAIIDETVVALIYDRVYKILKIKYDSTTRLIDTVKKIISMRIQQMQLGMKV